MPVEIKMHFPVLDVWSTDLRYRPSEYPRDEPEEFLASAAHVIRWADGRFRNGDQHTTRNVGQGHRGDHQVAHPQAEIDLYRQNSVSVRVRIVDPEFKRQSKPQRNQEAWKYLENLPDDVQSDISMLLLLAPDERERSFANLEFEVPVPSNL